MGCDQSTDAGARWRRTYAADLNAERPARRNLRNDTFILGTKFPTATNYAQQEKSATEKNAGQTVMVTVDNTSNNNMDDGPKSSNLLVYAQNSTTVVSKGAVFLGMSQDDFKNLKAVTEQELAMHDKETDCWVAIYGIVFNITEYLSSHPGGIATLTGECGRDITTSFRKHGNLARAEEVLKTDKAIKIVGRLQVDEVQKKKKKKSIKDKKSKRE
jgi:cytochrome b involved in lipid metabolism